MIVLFRELAYLYLKLTNIVTQFLSKMYIVFFCYHIKSAFVLETYFLRAKCYCRKQNFNIEYKCNNGFIETPPYRNVIQT